MWNAFQLRAKHLKSHLCTFGAALYNKGFTETCQGGQKYIRMTYLFFIAIAQRPFLSFVVLQALHLQLTTASGKQHFTVVVETFRYILSSSLALFHFTESHEISDMKMLNRPTMCFSVFLNKNKCHPKYSSTRKKNISKYQ